MIKLIYLSLHLVFFLVRTYKIYSVSNVKIYRIVLLTIATILYIRLPEIFHLINWKFVLFNHLHFQIGEICG